MKTHCQNTNWGFAPKGGPVRGTAKVVGAVLLAGAFIVGLIGLAWWLEEYSKRIKTMVVEQPGGHLFIIEMEEKEGGTAFIQCDEEEFEDAFKQFRRFLNVKEPPLSIPGGPMVVAHTPIEVSPELKPAQRALVEVLKRHSPRRVILLAHSDCLLYDTVAAWQDKLGTVKQRQFEDLKQAVAVLKRWLPNSSVEVYYALKDGKRLLFNPVNLAMAGVPAGQKSVQAESPERRQ